LLYKFGVLSGSSFGTLFQYANLNNSGPRVENSSERYKETREYKRLIVEGGLLPSLNKPHIVCILSLLAALVSCFFLVLNIYFFEGGAIQLVVRVMVCLAAMVASTIVFYLTLLAPSNLSQDALGNQNELSNIVHLVSINAYRAEVKKTISGRVVLKPVAFFVVAARTVILNRHFKCQYFFAAHNPWILRGPDLPGNIDSLSGENSSRAIWNLPMRLLYSSNKHSPLPEKVGTGNKTEILDLWSNIEGDSFFSPRLTYDYLSARIFPDVIDSNSTYSDVGSVSRIERVSSNFHLPAREKGIQQNQSSCYLGPKILFSLLGCVLLVVGLLLLSKVIDKVYLDPRFNVDMAVGGFFLAAALFWLGGWIIFIHSAPFW
jgi:hypothetical protein